MGSNNLCERCQLLDLSSLTRDELPRSHPITWIVGFLSDLVNRQEACQFCRLITRAFAASWKQNPPPLAIAGNPISCTLQNRVICVVTENDKPPRYNENFAANRYLYSNCHITITADAAPPGCPTTVEIQAVDKGPGIRGLFDDAELLSRRPKERMAEVDFGLVRKWVGFCSENHGEVCEREAVPNDHDDAYVASFRLIDVRRGCVVDARPEWGYVALSYMWGKTPMLKLVVGNREKLYENGALEIHRVPKTIRDAVEAVNKMEKRYLWVDALCILQDDYKEKARVIGEMDLIYSRAELTLVAASGDNADAGLPGLVPGSRDIDAFEERMRFGAGEGFRELMVARSPPSTAIDRSRWNDRGWTYQERLFSRRMLLFTDEQVLYWCGRSLWCEDKVLETDDRRFFYEDTPLYRFRVRNDPSVPFMKQAEHSPGISAFEEYAKSVEEFSRRELSFHGDVLDAFAGLLRSIKSSYKPDPGLLIYYFGLPSVWFELALLWSPLPTSKIRRRDATFCQSSEVEIPFPSWSWTGWVGQVEFKYPANIEARTRPEIEWYVFDVHGAAARVPSSGAYHTPSPWFQSSTESRPLREKWKPVGSPVDVRRSGVLDREFPHRPGTHLLMFYSSCAFLPIMRRNDGLAVEGNKSDSVCQYFIVGESKGWINLDAEWVASHPSPTYEFVVISRSIEDDWRAPGMLDLLNVMLIERYGEATYRVGVGSVFEAIWAEAEPEWKFVHLG